MSLTMETTTTWVPTCEVEDLEPGWGEVALLGRTQVALLRLDEEEVYAVDHHDPHTGAPVMARASSVRGATGRRSHRRCTRRSTTSAPGSASPTARWRCAPIAPGSSAA